MAGWRVHGPEKDGDKRMERQSKGWRGLEAYCKWGQGPPRAVAPPKKKKKKKNTGDQKKPTIRQIITARYNGFKENEFLPSPLYILDCNYR